MNLSLYQINTAIEDLIESSIDKETGELLPEVEAKLDALQIDRKVKIVNIGLYFKSLSGFIEAAKTEKKRITELQDRIERHQERLKEYLKTNLESGEEIHETQINIGWRKSEALIEDNDFSIEKLEKQFPEFVRTKKELDKTNAKKYMKENQIGIEGLRIETKNNIQIK